MNYLKYKAARLRKHLDLHRPDRQVMDRIEKYYDQAVAAKNWIIRANLRLVVSIAKRQFGPGETFFELVSDGNMSLMRAVEKFDFARGYKFSTYASWAIMKNFARTIPDRFRHCDRFRTSQSEAFEGATDVRPDAREQERAQSQREAQVARILARLDPREQKIIIRRYGLHRGREPLTLKQVGVEMGVTKERIRQIQARGAGQAPPGRRRAKDRGPHVSPGPTGPRERGHGTPRRGPCRSPIPAIAGASCVRFSPRRWPGGKRRASARPAPLAP